MKEILDVASLRQCEGFFLGHRPATVGEPWPGNAGLHSGPAQDYEFVYTFRNSLPSIKPRLRSMIQNARNKIFITSFLIGDQDVLGDLIVAAHRLRGGVYAITALDEEILQSGLDELEEDATFPDKILRHFEGLSRQGVYLRGHASCHAKFIVVDDTVALVTSANFIRDAFEKTGESGIIIRAPSEVKRLARFFTRLWFEGCTWEVAPGETYSVATRDPERSPCTAPELALESESGVIWTNDQEQGILHNIRDLLAGARESVLMASYTFNRISEPEHRGMIFDDIQAAMSRGLSARMLVRARNHLSHHRADAAALAKLGIEIYADHVNHAKGIIVDGCRGALYSANFDSVHGLTNGVEVGVRLDGQPALSDAVTYLEHAIEQADLRFECQPSQARMNEAFWWDGRARWPLPPKVAILCDESTWRAFAESCAAPPVLFEVLPNSAIELHGGSSHWSLKSHAETGQWRLLPAIGNDSDSRSASQRLPDWFRASHQTRSRRGFCAALFEHEA